MGIRFLQRVRAVLPAAALMAIVSGPTPAAASARCRAAQEEAAQRKTEASAQGASTTTSPEPAPVQGRRERDKPNELTSFVAPILTKPADGGSQRVSLAAAMTEFIGLGSRRTCCNAPSAPVACLQTLHCPSYRAQAPPADTFPIV